ncbi:hypothetical protein JMUB3933_1625 [Leptotrichia wadei]|uniref:Uncharacterized protein n=1 Tax=Leptotrichia wadei TaxID=157687 RepID=A0A510KD44_9FUSO|nr:hypothetical protein JMUB3933_1625 [Leptotrichia wadei]
MIFLGFISALTSNPIKGSVATFIFVKPYPFAIPVAEANFFDLPSKL